MWFDVRRGSPTSTSHNPALHTVHPQRLPATIDGEHLSVDEAALLLVSKKEMPA
jgi:hypothetical protein